jgi:hypothetical protein
MFHFFDKLEGLFPAEITVLNGKDGEVDQVSEKADSAVLLFDLSWVHHTPHRVGIDKKKKACSFENPLSPVSFSVV